MLRVTVISQGPNGGPAYNNFYDQGSDAGAAADAHGAVAVLFSGLASVLSNTTAYTVQPEVELVDPVTGNITGIFTVPQVVGAGTWGSGRSPGGVALVLRWRTGVFVGGREIRGRSYITGLGDINEGNSDVSGTVSLDVQNAQTAYLGAASEPVVWSPTHGQAELVTGSSVWSKFGLIRSRRD